ncbi:MAG: hypothetical protein R3Y15_02685 [Rikenellaceae bacterium]
MRILWFSPTPSLYHPYTNSHNGGGWVCSLEKIVREEKDIELGVANHYIVIKWYMLYRYVKESL